MKKGTLPGFSSQWCEPPCVLPSLHFGDCWDGTYCENCPGACPYCDKTASCPCIESHPLDEDR